MLTFFSTRVLTSSHVSVGTFVKHFPIQKSRLKFTTIPAKVQPFSAASVSLSTSDAVAGVELDSTAGENTAHLQTLTSHQRHQIHLYVDSLVQWNQKMNLTSVKEEDEIIQRHVEDSLAIVDPLRSSYLSHCGKSFDNLNVVDVGSGAGLPGIILAIACPSWKMTLLESINKKCVFLEHVVGSIGLYNVRVIRDRAENLGQNLDFREGYDIAVARAVAEMRVLAEYCLPLVRVGGLFLAAKGHDPQEEVTRAARAVHLMGATPLQTCLVESHSKYGQRTAIICLKSGPTPKKYPRAPGTPSKLPL